MKSNRKHHARRRGFTLMELLVVIGIILVLAALLLPMVNRARRQAQRATVRADLITISQTLDQYHSDFGIYPQTGTATMTNGSTVTVSGAAALCWALVAPGPVTQDGAGIPNLPTGTKDTGAPGFRTSPTGQGAIKGPYLPMDHFRIGTVPASTAGSNQIVTVVPDPTGSAATTPTTFDDAVDVLADGLGNPILYWPSYPQFKGNGNASGSWAVGSTPTGGTFGLFNYQDNQQLLPYTGGTTNQLILTSPNFLTQKVFATRLGSSDGSGKLNGTTDVAISAPYLLWTAGPDGFFGPRVNSDSGGIATGDDDDVTNVDLNAFPTGQAP